MIIAGGSDFGKRARLAAINGLVAQSGGWRQLDYADPINAGLVGYWPLDGGSVSRSTIFDLSGLGNNGTLANGPSVVTGKIGQALALANASHQFADLGANLSTPTAVTFSAWLNTATPGTLGWLYASSDVNGDTQFGVEYGRSPGKLDTIWGTGGTGYDILYSSASISSGVWQHVAVTRTGSGTSWTATLYINGVVDSIQAGTHAPATYLRSFLGTYRTSDPFSQWANGSLDDVRVFNRALTASEIYRIYSDTSGNLGFETQGRRLFSFVGGLFTFLWNDTAATSETTSGAMLATATLPDTGAPSEALAGVGRSTATLSDTATSTDTMTAFLVSVALLSDSLSSADLFALLNAGVYFFAWSDGLTATDTTAGVGRATGAVSDSAATSDGATGFAVATALLSDGAAASELFAAIMRGAGLVSDTAASSDTPAGQAVAALLDAAASTDAWQAATVLAGTLADAAGTSDTVSGTLAAVIAALNDAAASSDALAFVTVLAKIKPFIVPVLTASTYRIARVASVNRTGSLSSVARIISA